MEFGENGNSSARCTGWEGAWPARDALECFLKYRRSIQRYLLWYNVWCSCHVWNYTNVGRLGSPWRAMLLWRPSVDFACPQGGVLSPLLWCVVVGDLLARLSRNGIFIQGYTDDICLFSGVISQTRYQDSCSVPFWPYRHGATKSDWIRCIY